jgi:hypothetical protein
VGKQKRLVVSQVLVSFSDVRECNKVHVVVSKRQTRIDRFRTAECVTFANTVPREE